MVQAIRTEHVFMLKIRDIVVALVLIGGLFVAMDGYAAADPVVDAKTALEQRATKYWVARQARDIRTQYDLESAALPGGWLTPDKMMALAGLPVKNVKIEEITIDGDHGKVRLGGNVLVGTLGWVPQTLEQTWVLIDGQWYHETQR